MRKFLFLVAAIVGTLLSASPVTAATPERGYFDNRL